MVAARNVSAGAALTNILHAMLGKGLGGLEQVFLDYQPILEAWAARRRALRRRGAQGRQGRRATGRTDPAAGDDPAFTDWDPITVGAARALVRSTRPDLILSHGQRPARVFGKAAGRQQRREHGAVCLHKPSFDVVARDTTTSASAVTWPSWPSSEALAEDHVWFIPNAVTPPPVQAQPFSREGKPVKIVAAGRLHSKKGFDVLIRAVGKLRSWDFDVTCEIAGEGDERDDLEALIQELDLDPCVKLVGWKDDVAGFLATGDLFAFPSHQEGFPLTLLEAMAVGLPVVATEIDGPVEILKEGINGRLVPDDDIDRLGEALGELISDRETAKRLGAAGRELVLAEYGPDELARRLEAALDGMLSKA
jgi:glycosyltransferase involved in cell wall biosynthesis